jgi:hypothetical protein
MSEAKSEMVARVALAIEQAIEAATGPSAGSFSSEIAVVAIDEACEIIASEVESITMSEMLLACGEMTAQERRTCRALLNLVAHRIRSSVGHQIQSVAPVLSPAAVSDRANEERRPAPNLGPEGVS